MQYLINKFRHPSGSMKNKNIITNVNNSTRYENEFLVNIRNKIAESRNEPFIPCKVITPVRFFMKP